MHVLPNIPISLLILLTGAIGVLPACTQRPQDGADITPPKSSVAVRGAAQIIIKFRDPRLDPSQSHFLGEISGDAGAALVHVRPMSGGAHVLRPKKPVDGVELDRIVARLGKRQDVEYVEPDRPMRHFGGTMQ